VILPSNLLSKRRSVAIKFETAVKFANLLTVALIPLCLEESGGGVDDLKCFHLELL